MKGNRNLLQCRKQAIQLRIKVPIVKKREDLDAHGSLEKVQIPLNPRECLAAGQPRLFPSSGLNRWKFLKSIFSDTSSPSLGGRPFSITTRSCASPSGRTYTAA